jgi:UDP-glucuronate 4-epimerase
MKILVTGAAGFIGFHLTKELLKKYKVIGIDNLNNYYSVKLKKNRLSELRKNKNFIFYKKNITNYSDLKKIFIKHKITRIYNMAAQAGVRYSILNPKKYLDSNVCGFFNILEICREFNIKDLCYASSSSVYGDSSKFPLNENDALQPINFYSLSKKNNEEMAEIYYKFYNIKSVGFRFFTVYGEFGRPDMFIHKLLDACKKKNIFYLNNYGKHLRDFTYVKDVIQLILKINKKKIKGQEVFNICSGKPINLKRIIKIVSNHFLLPKIKYLGLQKADVIKTHGDNHRIIKNTQFKNFTSIDDGVNKMIEWYKWYYKK